MARPSIRALVAAALSAALPQQAAAQASPPGGTVGVWDHIQPNTNAAGVNPYPGNPALPNPVTSLWAHSTFGESGVFVAGNDAAGAAHLFGFDVVAWVWTPFTNAVANFQAADLFSFGGFAIAAGGSTDDNSQQLQFIPTNAGAGAQWLTASMTGVPSAQGATSGVEQPAMPISSSKRASAMRLGVPASLGTLTATGGAPAAAPTRRPANTLPNAPAPSS